VTLKGQVRDPKTAEDKDSATAEHLLVVPFGAEALAHTILDFIEELVFTRDVVLGLGPWLSLRTKLQSFVLALALNPQSLVLPLALKVST